MTEGPIGISLSGNAAPPSTEYVPAVVALAGALEANARAIERNAEAVQSVTRYLQGTPAIQGATISGCSVTMAPPAPVKAKPRKRARR